MTKDGFRAFAWATLGVTLAVILWGAYVRASGSGAGCGSHWPTCNGEVLPRAKSVATVIEFAHRASTVVVSVMAVLQLVWAFVALPRRHPARAGAVASMVFMVMEALVGAALVLFQLVADDRSVARAAWMSVHLVNTFLLVASMTCTAWWASDGAPVRLRGQGAVLWLTGAGAAGLLAVGVSGAITALGDTLFTAPTLARALADDLSPAAHFLQQLRVLHPIAAVVVATFLFYARGAIARRRAAASPHVARLSTLLAALLAGQLALGVVNLVLLAPIAMQMAHLLMADLVWIVFVLLATASLADTEVAGENSAPLPGALGQPREA